MKKRIEASTFVMGLVGGIGSGKSTVARQMRGLGARVLDADRIAHEVLRSPRVVRKVRHRWPGAAAGGRIDRRRLGAIVFSGAGALARLERILHPEILRRMRRLLAGHRRAGRTVVIDAPLLLEKGLGGLCDIGVFVEAPRAQRIRRAARRHGWSPGELSARERRQWPLEKKRGACALRLYNRGSRKTLLRETLRIWKVIQNRRSSVQGRPG